MMRRERVFPSPTSPKITAKHSLPSLMAKIVSEITFSMDSWQSTYIEESGTLSKGGLVKFQ